MAKQAGVDLKDQRNARKALRNLVKRLRTAKDEQWEEIITSAIMGELAIFSYITAVTVQTALVEAGADPDLCTKIILALKESQTLATTLQTFGMSLADIPFGE